MVLRNELILCSLLLAIGCADSTPSSQTKLKKPQEPGKVTEFDPNSGAVEVDHKQKITDPITGPLAALQNAKIDIPQLAIQHALDLFNAAEGRYPNSFEEFMTRVTDGLQFRDQANQMRLAEYQNAFAVIQAYPVFGIGFGAAPEIDLVAGVSSVYLAIAPRTGLVGLAAFLALIATFFSQNWQALRQATSLGDDERAAWLVSLQAGIAAALAVGLLDHYFFNIEFSHMVMLFWGVIGLAVVEQRDHAHDDQPGHPLFDRRPFRNWRPYQITTSRPTRFR